MLTFVLPVYYIDSTHQCEVIHHHPLNLCVLCSYNCSNYLAKMKKQ